VAVPGEYAVHERFMRQCIQLAEAALAMGETPVGALLVRDGDVIAEAGERTRTRHDPSAHAEVEAIRAACQRERSVDLSNCTLYTTVEPCVLCSYVIRRVGVSRVVYGVAAGQAGGVTSRYSILSDAGLRGWAAPPEVISGVLAAACGAVLTGSAAASETSRPV
jgi:tRNA(adenine34) deaminase